MLPLLHGSMNIYQVKVIINLGCSLRGEHSSPFLAGKIQSVIEYPLHIYPPIIK